MVAGQRENTKAAYQSALKHFHHTWGGPLPASETDVCQYVSSFAGTHKVSTIKLRLAALSKFHRDCGFLDPTSGETIKQLMKGVQRKYNAPPKQAKPLSLLDLRQIVAYLDRKASDARQVLVNGPEISPGKRRQAKRAVLAASRDKALMLLGFWRGFRSDEISRLSVPLIKGERGQGLEIYLPYTKGDRSAEGTVYPVPALKELCPADAYYDWLDEAGLSHGAVFRRIDRLGNISLDGISASNLGRVLIKICRDAGVDPEGVSTHSLRRGFAFWASESSWDLRSLMEYIGWKNVKNAQGYLPTRFNFGELSLQPRLLNEGGARLVSGREPAIPGDASEALPSPATDRR